MWVDIHGGGGVGVIGWIDRCGACFNTVNGHFAIVGIRFCTFFHGALLLFDSFTIGVFILILWLLGIQQWNLGGRF